MDRERSELKSTFYGSQAPGYRCVAYCWKHRKWMTVKQLKRRGCLGRGCDALQKKDDHPYWERREAIKKLKKERKYGRSF